MFQLSPAMLRSAENQAVVHYSQLLGLFHLVVNTYSATKVANAKLLMDLVNERSDSNKLIDPKSVCYLLTLYSLIGEAVVHDCYNSITDPGFLHFAGVVQRHNLLDGI